MFECIIFTIMRLLSSVFYIFSSILPLKLTSSLFPPVHNALLFTNNSSIFVFHRRLLPSRPSIARLLALI